MSANTNIVILKGNIGKEPEVVETKSGHVTKFTLAVYRSGKGNDKITDWFNVVYWHNKSELKKGDGVIVIGSIINRTYEAEGVKKYITEVVARDIAIIKNIIKEEDEEEIPF